jgi:hypothetical protein
MFHRKCLAMELGTVNCAHQLILLFLQCTFEQQKHIALSANSEVTVITFLLPP